MNHGKPTKLVKLGNPKGKDAATKRDRGNLRFQKGQEGQTDYVEVCFRVEDGAYLWKRLVTQDFVLLVAQTASTTNAYELVEVTVPKVETPAPVEAPAPQAEAVPATA